VPVWEFVGCGLLVVPVVAGHGADVWASTGWTRAVLEKKIRLNKAGITRIPLWVFMGMV
jgi:hypothetical protein